MYYNNNYSSLGNSFDTYSSFNDLGGLSSYDTYSSLGNMANRGMTGNFSNMGNMLSGRNNIS